MALIPGAIPVTGFIGPTDSTDTYAVTDALYGIDGWRNVEDATERDAITDERRRKGMIVGTKDDGNFWKLLTDGPWNYDSTDWDLFITGAGPITSGLWENIGGNIVTSSTMFSPGPPHVLPYFDDQQDLGSKLNRWRDLYLGSVVDFSSVLDFVVGGGSPDDSILRVDNVGLSVYSGKAIRGLTSTNYIDLDIAGAFGISTDAGAFANNKFITLGGASGTFSWSDGIGTGSLAIDNTQLLLQWAGGFSLGAIQINTTELTIGHNAIIGMNTNTYWVSGAQIRDNLNVPTIDTNIRFMYDGSSVASVVWDSRFLLDNGGIDSVLWNDRLLMDSIGQNSLNWQDRLAYNSSGTQTIDWENHETYDSTGAVSVNWNTRNLVAGGGVVTVDWDASQLKSFGGLVSFDWGTLEMFDLGGTLLSADFANRILYDETGINVLRWTGNEIHLFGAALTGTAMNGISLSNTGAAVTITGDTGMTFQSSSGFGLNVDVSNLTTLNGSDMNLTSDGFILATAATDSILNMTATDIELSNANASGLINIATTNHGLSLNETAIGTRALVYSTHSSALNTSTSPLNYSRVIAGSSGYAGSISQIYLEGRDSTGGYKATIDMNPAAATPVIDLSITSSADFINPHTILRLNGLTYLAEFRDGIGSFTDNSIVMHPTNRELYDSIGAAVINWTNAAAEGIVYDQDYSATYVARSLVDYGYVTSAISGVTLASVLAAGNTTGANNIVISTTQNIRSGNGGAQIDLDYGAAAGVLVLSTDNGALANGNFFSLYGGAGSQTAIWWSDNGSNAGNILFDDVTGMRLEYNGSYLTIGLTGEGTYTSADGAGLQYAADYSAGYTARSLVDKEYVDAVFVNNNKYVHGPAAFTGGTVVTITHGLNTTDVICDVINTATNTKVWGARIDNYLINSIDVTISVTGTYKVVIVG